MPAHGPERVAHRILHGGFVQGRLVRGDDADREQADAFLALMRHGWGQPGSQFLQALASIFAPDATRSSSAPWSTCRR